MGGPPLEQDVVVGRSLELDASQRNSLPIHAVCTLGVAGELGLPVPGLEAQAQIGGIIEAEPTCVFQYHRVAANGKLMVLAALPGGVQVQDLLGVLRRMLSELQIPDRLEQVIVQHQLPPGSQIDGDLS